MRMKIWAAHRWRLALLDLDGTLYQGSQAVPGADAFVERLRISGVQPVFFTNNATRTPQQVADKLGSLGIKAHPEEVCTSAQAAADWLKQHVDPDKGIVYIGMDGVEAALQEAGMRHAHVRSWHPDDFQPGAAVMGLDTSVTYADLAVFCRVVVGLRRFVLTNPDLALPGDGGLQPGNGAFGRLVEAVTGVGPVVTGKPEPYFVDYALRRFGAARDEVVLIGDNPRTDIALGKRCGVHTIRVRTGLGAWVASSEDEADWVVDSVADL